MDFDIHVETSEGTEESVANEIFELLAEAGFNEISVEPRAW